MLNRLSGKLWVSLASLSNAIKDRQTSSFPFIKLFYNAIRHKGHWILNEYSYKGTINVNNWYTYIHEYCIVFLLVIVMS